MTTRAQAEKELAKKENGRWIILTAVHAGGHLGATDDMILAALLPSWLDVHRNWVRDELAYLESRKLVDVERHPIKPWRVTLSRHGRDIVDYTVDCEAGIARPARYWGEDAPT